MSGFRDVTPAEMAAIPGLHFLRQVGPLHSHGAPHGSLHEVRAVVRADAGNPLARGRAEWSHVMYVEASYNLSHWITNQVEAVRGVFFRSATVFPRGMGLPALRPDEDIPAHAQVRFQQNGGRWRGEVDVTFFRADGSLAETVSYPLVERLDRPPGAR